MRASGDQSAINGGNLHANNLSYNKSDNSGLHNVNNGMAIEPSEADREQLTELQASLKELLEVQKDTEYLDLSEQSINSIDKDLMPYISQFENLKELNLEDNNITEVPDDLSTIFRNITIINLNGN